MTGGATGARRAGVDAEADALIAQYVEVNPRWPALEDAQVVGAGVSVWALIAHYRAVGADKARVAAAYDLPEQAVEAAVQYYQRHRALIDARLALNAAAFKA
jgi:uncharacterized protein (DUF433 family)